MPMPRPTPGPRPTPAILAASHKVSELIKLEHRLLAASARAQEAGYERRANSYMTQASAVRRERQRWVLIAGGSSSAGPFSRLFAAATHVAVPLVDAIVAFGDSTRRMCQYVFAFGLSNWGVLPDAFSARPWALKDVPWRTPQPWVREIAHYELDRKNVKINKP